MHMRDAGEPARPEDAFGLEAGAARFRGGCLDHDGLPGDGIVDALAGVTHGRPLIH